MLFVLLIIFFCENTIADLRCPFESCSSSYDSYGCTIVCESQNFPSKSQMIENRIFKLSFSNLKNIPKDAFKGFEITTLEIESQNVEFVDEKAFANVLKLDSLTLSNLNNFSIFSDKIQLLSNITSKFSVSNVGLTETSVVSFLDSFKTWNKLESLSISNNHLVRFKYDFDVFFPNLKTLTISHNSIENFDIKCHNLSTLNINNNQITKLDKEMLLNLPKLQFLKINSNKISKIYKDSFLYTQLLVSIDLENNTINYIEEKSFCKLTLIKRLKLSHNNLKSTSLYCLETVAILHLSNVEFDGEIDQKRIGNPISAFLLNLSHNKIKKISLEKMAPLKRLDLSSNELDDLTLDTIRAFANLTELSISKNKFTEQILEKFAPLKHLTYLCLSHNYLSRISASDLKENKNLYKLEVDHNQIEYVRFAALEKIDIVNLGNNKLRQISEEAFSNLKYLDQLYIDSNKIEKIHAKAFEFNELLLKLDLSNNFLTTTPDIKMLSFLQILNLNNNKIAILPNNAFERYQWTKNTKITIDLRNNNISSFSSKSFCAQATYSLGNLSFELLLDDINQMDKCLLSQFGSDHTKIGSSLQPSCEHLQMAKYKNIKLNADISKCQNLSIDFARECHSNSKFKCPRSEELVRYSTWITGDPHLYSYKKKYELCSTGQDAVCFQYGDFQLLCSDSHAGGANKLVTVLVKVKFIYKVSESVSVSYEANSTSFADFFDNGKTIINKNAENLAVLSSTKEGMKAIYVPKANTHIFISRWNSYYSITLRATHETYSQSTGYLYDGCRLQDQLSAVIKEENFECDSECSNIEISAQDESFPEEIIRDVCLFDCHEIGTNSTTMIKTMVENIKTFILSDSNTNVRSTPTGTTATITSPTRSDTTKGFRLIENMLLRFCMFFLALFIFY